MPSVSKSQQRLMGQAYQVLQWKNSGGKEGLDPEDIEPRYRLEIEDLAASMKEEDLKAYAETKHTDLPEVAESSITGFFGAAPFPKFTTYTNNVGPGAVSAEKDKRDPLVQSFMDYIEGKKPKIKDAEDLEENFDAPAASTANTPGMGNVTPATANTVGSGDKMDNLILKKKKKKKAQIEEAIALVVPLGTPHNGGTPGMGSSFDPDSGNVDADDTNTFDNDEDNLEDKIGIMSYTRYKQWLAQWKNKQDKK
jgi:hypothetical protein